MAAGSTGVPIAPRATAHGSHTPPRSQVSPLSPTSAQVDPVDWPTEHRTGHHARHSPEGGRQSGSEAAPRVRRRVWLTATLTGALGLSATAALFVAVPAMMATTGTAANPMAATVSIGESTSPPAPRPSPTSMPRGGWVEHRARLAAPAPAGSAQEPTLSAAGPGTSGASTIDTQAASSAPIIAQSELLALVRANFPADEISNAMAVAECESSQQSIRGPVNGDGTSDWGIFQLNDGGTLQGALAAIGVSAESTAAAQVAAMDPEINVVAAAHIFADRGWGAWTCGFKQGIVAAIGSTTPGPLNGAYTIGGIDLTPLAPPDWSGSAPAASPAPPATPTPTGPPAGKPKKPRPSLPSPPPGSAPAPSPSVPLPSPTSQSPSPAASTPTATVPASDGAE